MEEHFLTFYPDLLAYMPRLRRKLESE